MTTTSSISFVSPKSGAHSTRIRTSDFSTTLMWLFATGSRRCSLKRARRGIGFGFHRGAGRDQIVRESGPKGRDTTEAPPSFVVASSNPVWTKSATSGKAFRHTSSTALGARDRKSTRLNSSHVSISYAVFCLKKKTTIRKKHVTVDGDVVTF